MEAKPVNLTNARNPEQREVMEGILSDEVCPFCIESLRKYHKQPIIEEGDNWIVTTNQWPYQHTNAHYLFIARQHIETVTEVPTGAFEELGGHVKNLVNRDGMEYGALAMRFGDTEYTGATVSHLHAHLIQAAQNLAEGEKVKFKISK